MALLSAALEGRGAAPGLLVLAQGMPVCDGSCGGALQALPAPCTPALPPPAPAGSLKGVGVPVKLLHEATGHICTVRRPQQARPAPPAAAAAAAAAAGVRSSASWLPCPSSPALLRARPPPAGGAEERRDLPRRAARRGGQLERAAHKRAGDGARRQGAACGAAPRCCAASRCIACTHGACCAALSSALPFPTPRAARCRTWSTSSSAAAACGL